MCVVLGVVLGVVFVMCVEGKRCDDVEVCVSGL